MKKSILSLIFCLGTLLAFSQESIKYTIVKDDPSVSPWLSVNLDIFGMEVTMPKEDFGTNFGIGLWGHVESPKLPVGIQYVFYRSYFDVGRLEKSEDFPNTTELQLGALYFFSDKTKAKTFAVGLSNKVIATERYKQGNKSYEKTTSETKSVDIPGHLRTQYGLRGGLMFRSSGFPLGEGLGKDPATGDPFEFASYGSTSIYAGILVRYTANLIIKTDNYGLVPSATKASNWFLDAIIAPVNSFRHPSDADINQLVKDNRATSPIGFRFGYQTYAIEQRAVSGQKFGLAVRGELGVRPYLGFYGAATIGITLVKSTK